MPAERVVASCPVQISSKFVMLLDCAASTVSSVAWMANHPLVLLCTAVSLMYSPPLRPSPLYSDVDAMISYAGVAMVVP